MRHPQKAQGTTTQKRKTRTKPWGGECAWKFSQLYYTYVQQKQPQKVCVRHTWLRVWGCWYIMYLEQQFTSGIEGGIFAWGWKALPLITRVERVKWSRESVGGWNDDDNDGAMIMISLWFPHPQYIGCIALGHPSPLAATYRIMIYYLQYYGFWIKYSPPNKKKEKRRNEISPVFPQVFSLYYLHLNSFFTATSITLATPFQFLTHTPWTRWHVHPSPIILPM